MKHFWVSILIVLSIALQSFVAVANSNDNHQFDSQHMQTEHSHELDNQQHDDASDDEHNINDCHHCGHCQGSHAQWFTGKKSQQTIPYLLMSNQYFHLEHMNQLFIEELIRPPIA